MSDLIPKNLKYTEEHDWILIEGDTATLGITDFAQKALGDVVYIELPDVGTSLTKGQTIGVIESIKSVTDLHTPVSGTVTGKNEEVIGKPDLCNSNPYQAWTIKLKISNKSEISTLLTPEKYEGHCQEAH